MKIKNKNKIQFYSHKSILEQGRSREMLSFIASQGLGSLFGVILLLCYALYMEGC